MQKLNIKIVNANVEHNKDYFMSVKELGINEIFFISSQFISNVYETHLFSFASSSYGSIQFINCQFIDNEDAYYLWFEERLVDPSLNNLFTC